MAGSSIGGSNSWEFARDHTKVAAGAFAEERSLSVIGDIGELFRLLRVACFFSTRDA